MPESEGGLVAVQSANLALRFLLELCALAAVSYWGWQAGASFPAKLALAIGVPLVVAVAWGLFVAPNAAVPLPGPLMFVLGLLILELAAGAVVLTGRRRIGLIFAVAALVNAVLMAVWQQ
jgi:Protein of unknown function (DUF2568)